MSVPDMIRAPFTSEQVQALNLFQERGGMHPFCCEHPHPNRVLVASHSGWYCPDPDCDYTQDWAHAFMANPNAWPKEPFARPREARGQSTKGQPLTTPESPAATIARAASRLRELATTDPVVAAVLADLLDYCARYACVVPQIQSRHTLHALAVAQQILGEASDHTVPPEGVGTPLGASECLGGPEGGETAARPSGDRLDRLADFAVGLLRDSHPAAADALGDDPIAALRPIVLELLEDEAAEQWVRGAVTALNKGGPGPSEPCSDRSCAGSGCTHEQAVEQLARETQ